MGNFCFFFIVEINGSKFAPILLFVNLSRTICMSKEFILKNWNEKCPFTSQDRNQLSY